MAAALQLHVPDGMRPIKEKDVGEQIILHRIGEAGYEIFEAYFHKYLPSQVNATVT